MCLAESNAVEDLAAAIESPVEMATEVQIQEPKCGAHKRHYSLIFAETHTHECTPNDFRCFVCVY